MPKLHDVIGHTSQLEELQEDIDMDNVSHAYLFAGPRHVGKMTVAYWFVEKLIGDKPRIENLTHPDLLVLDQLWIEKECEDWDKIAQTSNVSQVHRSKKPSPARTNTISIDDIRALQERLHETSIGERRCCIIRSLERMQDTAATALLKILEEPPAGLTFILTTQSLPSLLPTIVSRTRTLHFQRLPHKAIRQILSGIDEDDEAFILHLAQGAPGIAQELCDDPDVLLKERQAQNAAVSFWETPSLQRKLQILAPLKERGKEADQLLLHLALSLRSQPPSTRMRNTATLLDLLHGLNTNAHRQLLTQAFALKVEQS